MYKRVGDWVGLCQLPRDRPAKTYSSPLWDAGLLLKHTSRAGADPHTQA